MELVYTNPRVELLEKRAILGRRLAYFTELRDDQKRRNGKTLRIVPIYQGDSRVPSIRVAGKWLQRYGFHSDGQVVLTVKPGLVVISIKKGGQHGRSLA